MLVARESCFYLSIFWYLICVAECGKYPPNAGVPNFNTCSSQNGKYNSLNHAFATYFGSNYAPHTQQDDDVCCNSELSHLSPFLFDQHSEAHCLGKVITNVNRSGPGVTSPQQSNSWDLHNFQLSDGGTITCSLNYREFGHGISCDSANNVDQKEVSFVSMSSEIGKSQFSSDSSSPRVRVSPYRLDWGQRYLHHPSMAHLTLQNACNESVLRVYESFSTNRQFYPFNTSEIVLGPGEITTIPFVFSPKWLGLSLAELILQTSFGGFLIEARGFVVESPHKLRPLLGLGVSSGGWLSRKLPLLNPYNETIHLKEVTAWFGVFGSSTLFLSESYCNKHDHQSDPTMSSSVRNMKFGSLGMEIRLPNNWMISPYQTESILELAFPPGSQGSVLGTICVQLVRSGDCEKDTLLIPFEAELNRTPTPKKNSLLSLNVESIGGCDGNETTLSVSVRNSASHLVKVIKVSEESEMKTKQVQIKVRYTEGLLLFPGTSTHVAMVSYEWFQLKYDSRYEMDDLNMGCSLQMLTNDTVSPILEIPCWDLLAVCNRQQKMLHHQLEEIDLSKEISESTTSSRNLPFSIKAFEDTEVDEFVLQSWRSQRTKVGAHVLDDHELSFPTVPLGSYYTKLITVRNPSQQPIIVQLILNSKQTIDNCRRTHYDNLLASPNNNILDNSVGPTKYGFSLTGGAVIEAYIQPYESAILGPIFFQPSNRCDWKGTALIRNNMSGLELVSLNGRGGSFSLALYEGVEFVHQLSFNTNLLFPPNMLPSDISPIYRDASFGCRKSLLKKLLAVNSGDFTVTVHGIHVSGTECGSDGFTVHNCKGFALEPGESVELGISYQPDFSASLVSRDLELMLATEILVIPMKACLPIYVLNICRKSIFWVRVKNFCFGGVLACVSMSLLFWVLMPYVGPMSSLDYVVKDDGSYKSDVRTKKDKSSSVNLSKGNNKPKKASPRSVQKDEPLTIFNPRKSVECGPEKVIPSDAPNDGGGNFEDGQPVSLTVRTRKDKKRKPRKRRGGGSTGLSPSLIEASSSQSGNSTPSSPLSPFTIVSPDEKRRPPSIQNKQPRDSTGLFGASGPHCTQGEEELLSCAGVSGNYGEPQVVEASKRVNKPILLPSATFPGMGTRSSPSRFTMPQDARAPGPKIQKSAELQAGTSSDESLTYDMWADHFSGLHLMTRPNRPNVISSEGNPDSFFLRGPRQTLLTNSRLKSVCTSSSSYEQG